MGSGGVALTATDLALGKRRRTSVIESSWLQQAAKRLLDITVSASLLMLCVPVIVLLMLAIVVESPGPVFFRVRRVGHGGRTFAMIKFRKMTRDAPGLAITRMSDPRFTRIGRLLAKWKLDEIPQLWNVLRGQMSLVGPRPEAPSFVAEREEQYRTILGVKQGITGLSQLAFFEELRILDGDDPMAVYRQRIWPQKIALDQMYAERATLAWDLRILYWSGVSCLLRRPVAVNRRTGRLGLRRR